jgi:hypothetical protein
MFTVVDYDHKTKIYTLRNPATGEIKTISKKDYEFYGSENKKKPEKLKR